MLINNLLMLDFEPVSRHPATGLFQAVLGSGRHAAALAPKLEARLLPGVRVEPQSGGLNHPFSVRESPCYFVSFSCPS